MSVRSRILGPPVPKMPPGLLELMDGLARDVLKNNPENIYEFCARHMQTLLEIRDGRAPRPLLTLDQKIENAQKKVRQRAEERRRAYDKIITENNNKQQVIEAVADTPHSGDDSVCSKEETNRNFIDVQPEEKEEVVIKKQETEQAAVLTTELKIGINGTNDELNKVEELKENKSDENKSNSEIVTVTNSDENEKNNTLTENEPETDDAVKDAKVENNVPKEVHPEATIDINIANNVAESLPDVPPINIENNDKTKEELNTPDDNNSHVGNEAAELIQNNDGTEVKNEIETDPKTTSDETFSSNTIEKVMASDDNLEGNSHLGIESEQIEKQIDGSLTNNLLNGNETPKIPLNTESNNNLPKQEVDHLNEPEKEKSPDEQILSVILDSDKDNNVPLQTTENDVIQPNELDSLEIIVTESISIEVESGSQQDIKSVPESAEENDKSNNSSMDLETAAITIQKVFRSFLFKTKTASYDDPTTVDITLLTEDKEKEDNDVPNIKDRRHLGISRMDTVLQTVNEEKSLSLSTDDSSTLSSAATIIQAHVRGFLVRNKINLNKTISSNSLIDSDAPSIPSLEADSDNVKSKTVLNIHIIPEGGHFVSRDESILTSMDLSLDSSPPSSVNLHPLGYDKTERRKQLKREDAIQSGSPPSNNSGKLSEDQDSVKEVWVVEGKAETCQVSSDKASVEAPDTLEKEEAKVFAESDSNVFKPTDSSADEMDVVTPFAEDRNSRESDNSTKLLHSGEFHDIVVPTNVTRTDASVVRGE